MCFCLPRAPLPSPRGHALAGLLRVTHMQSSCLSSGWPDQQSSPGIPETTDTRARNGYRHLPLSLEWLVMQQKLADTEIYLWKGCAPGVLLLLSFFPFHLQGRWWVLLAFYSRQRP